MPEQPCGDALAHGLLGDIPLAWALVADGLGSGPSAALASEAACACAASFVAEFAGDSAHVPAWLVRVLHGCDRALRGTRGAAVGLVVLDSPGCEGWFAGIGNVELRVAGEAGFRALSSPGIVGCGFALPRVECFAWSPGSTALLHSDGLSARFEWSAQMAQHWKLADLAEHLLATCTGKPDDVGLILLRAARLEGPSPPQGVEAALAVVETFAQPVQAPLGGLLP